MKRISCLLAVVVAVAAFATARVTADSDARSVTGAAKGTFGAGAALGAVSLNGVELGAGVFIEPDGSASGTFHATLHGTELGSARELTLEGKIAVGSIGDDGRASFSGTASIDFGDGTPPLPSVPFSVIAGTDGLVLVIDSVTLPAAGLTAGAMSID